MEVWSAIQCASAVLSFVDFASKLLSGTYDVYTGSSSLEPTGKDLKSISNSLHSLRKDLETNTARGSASKANSQIDIEIQRLVQECQTIVDSLISIIDKVCQHEGTGPSVWSSFKEALATLWKNKEIQELQKQLEGHQRQLELLMIAATRSAIATLGQEHAVSAEKVSQVHDMVWDLKRSLQQNGTIQATVLRNIHGTGSVSGDTAHDGAHVFTAANFVNDLLGQLKFKEMEHRYEAIRDAHKKTLRWIFSPSGTRTKRKKGDPISFLHWMESEDVDLDIYWVTGKPGSGKSTLMKFILDSDRTSQTLQKWADPRALLILSSYFWNSGNKMQTNRNGLLRRLLYEAVRQREDLALTTFQDRYRAYSLLGPFAMQDPWTDEELHHSLRRLVDAARATMNVAIFIDGLDEFEGKPREVIALLDSLRGPYTKLCVSSRAWPEFQEEYSKMPHLKMEDVNGPDINNYVDSKLVQHPRFPKLNTALKQALIRDIRGKARGVFLWVYLVTGMLTDALTDGEKPEKLRGLIESLPEELSLLFDKILLPLENNPEDFRKTSQLLQIVQGARSQLSISAIELHYAEEDDPEEIFRLPVRLLTREESQEKVDRIEWLVAARTKGLLEVVPASGWPRWYDKPRIEFSHRSISDYIKDPEVWRRFTAATDTAPKGDHDDGFNTNERLALSQFARLKVCTPRGSVEEVNKMMIIAIHYIDLAYPRGTSSSMQHRFIQELGDTAVRAMDDEVEKDQDTPPYQGNEPGGNAFRLLAIDTEGPFPCEHDECAAKVIAFYMAVRFGVKDFLESRFGQLDLPLECKDGWGIFLFSLQHYLDLYAIILEDRARRRWPPEAYNDIPFYQGEYGNLAPGGKEFYQLWKIKQQQKEKMEKKNKNVVANDGKGETAGASKHSLGIRKRVRKGIERLGLLGGQSQS